MPLLQLVDRIIIMDGQKIVMDGPKTQVLEQLQKNDNKGSDNKTSVRVSKPQVKVISKKTDNTQANSDD